MTATRLALIAAGGSGALLLGAFVFQALGYPPCQLCLWQRWPHWAAVVLGAAASTGISVALWALAGAGATLLTAGIGVFHTGVERGWWQGPQGCSAPGGISGLSGAELLSTEGAVDIVRCDEVAWALGGLSMASWNALISLALAGLWLLAAWRARTSAT